MSPQTLAALAFANLRRRRLRSVVTASGVGLAVALAFSLLAFLRGYERGLQNELTRLGAHLLVVPKGCPYDAASLALHGASWPCYLQETYLKTIQRTAHVAVAAPVLMEARYDPQSRAQMVYCGVEPDVLRLKPGWHIDGSFPQNSGELLAGFEAARTYHWKVGDVVVLPGTSPVAQGRVSGILQPTSGPDDLFLWTRLSDAQKLWKRPNELTHILVRLDNPDNVDVTVRDLRGCDAGLEMTVVPLAHLFQTIQNLAQSTRLLLGCVALTALLAAGAGMGNTVLMAVSERAREIGVLRAVGASRLWVFGLIWFETVLLSLLGGVAGIALSLGGAGLLEAWLRARLPYAPHENLLRFDLPVALGCLALSVVVGTLAALVPAWRAARLSPVQAMRGATGFGGALA